ncbi:MAG TPA: tetratricopeptide repeat protein [Candidatus Acidoferrum sp.]|nr:tetratricopeptide repeat protein [Candidatus Acidoferrum sp.]
MRSPNFVVVSNASDKDARKFDVQFEQIREVFRKSLYVGAAHPTPLITVLAVKNEASMKQLLPQYWQKGRAHPAGIFIPNPSLNLFFIAVQMDAPGENPYQTTYHEYYHSLTTPYYPGLPLWLSEGLAEFFGNTTIEGDRTILGRPNDESIYILKQTKMIPLDVLFKVDQNSPYYSQDEKVNIFYAESWALTHYLWVGDREAHQPMLKAYLAALQTGATEEEAATKAFGNLKKLQETLERYVSSFSFSALEMQSPPKLADSQISSRQLSDAEAEAYRAGFAAADGRPADARPLLEDALKLDPHLALAHEYLGLAMYYQGQTEAARAELGRAIQLDPKNATTRYLHAVLTYRAGGSKSNAADIEDDLRAGIAANPNFAGSYSLLGLTLAVNGQELNEALAMAQKAVDFEPANPRFQLTLAQVYARMQKFDDAQLAGLRALSWTKDPQVKAEANSFLRYLQAMRQYTSESVTPSPLKQTAGPTEAVPTSKTMTVSGVASRVTCDSGLKLDVRSNTGVVHLRLMPGANISILVPADSSTNGSSPCASLEGKNVEARYISDQDAENSGGLISLQVLPTAVPSSDEMRGHAPPGATIVTVEGTAARINCRGPELFLTLAVEETSITLHAKDAKQIEFRSNTTSVTTDGDPCSQLSGRTLMVGFVPDQHKDYAGQIQTILVEK